jgi:hypothetical protein
MQALGNLSNEALHHGLAELDALAIELPNTRGALHIARIANISDPICVWLRRARISRRRRAEYRKRHPDRYGF